MVTCRNRDRTGSEMEDDEEQAAALSQKIIALLKGSNVSQFVALMAVTDVLHSVLGNIHPRPLIHADILHPPRC